MDGKTPREMFSHTHKGLVKAGSKWLTNTATSCSVVATLIATVAVTSSTSTAPGGAITSTTNTKTRKPTIGRANPSTDEIFAILPLIALCFSVTSLVTFVAILTSKTSAKRCRGRYC
ncbi:PGG domain containing protein [Parasponia andersonii]|uniref:PGG domain containing protein n=1 Tax=Parasponia andersonii TaxID=3476 RepID=A0A2P5DSD4_PARAD|nr:PGG domain containing protein [Parasponia andersonii]